MPVYKAPVSDTVFLLSDVFDYARYSNLPRFAEAPLDVVEAVLSEGAKFAEEVLQPLNLPGDQEGCRRAADGSVTTPKGFKEAYRAYVEGGWVGVSGLPQYGGQGLPHFLSVALSEYTISANQAFAMYPGLTTGAAAALQVHGSDELKARYLPKMTSGEWTGTMNLTEPHCGTDLGMIKSRAVRNGDGSFAISGQKIFISAGEHDKNRIGFVVVDVAQHDNDVGLVFDQGNRPAHAFNNRNHVPRAGLFGGREVSFQIAHQYPDHRHAQAANILDYISLTGQKRAFFIFDIRRYQRELGDFDEGEDALPSIVELVIAEGGNINTHQIGDFVDGKATVNRGNGGSLHQVAGIEIETRRTVLALIAHGPCHVRETAQAAIVRT